METPDEINVLKAYRKLAEGLTNQIVLLKEKTGILYAAAALESKNQEVVKVAIEIFQLLIMNEENHPVLMSIFGIFEALETLAIRLRITDAELSETVRQMISNLRQSSPPAFNTRQRMRSIKQKQKSVVFVFHITGLNMDTRDGLEVMLVRLRGVVSVVMDVDHQRCTMRVLPNLSARYIVQEISHRCGLRARYIVRNTQNKEILRDLMMDESTEDSDNLPPYLPEEDSPCKPKAVSSLNGLKQSASDWIHTAATFWNKTFYW